MIDYTTPRASAEARMATLKVGTVFMFSDDKSMPQTWIKVAENAFRVSYDTIVFSFGWGPGVAFSPTSMAWMDARDLVVLDFEADPEDAK
jgi:hypothetical protein